MAKPKTMTPQELYRQRKQREEQEKEAFLPPGLINHGNTCFMNSVLQGLIATRLLSDLLLSPEHASSDVSLSSSIVSRRSPQLTNGHGLGGAYEKEWEEGMPLGDVFMGIMQKALDAQRNRTREIMSPKILLSTLGKKYDQYLDFAQQDAHEFLRQLLDAMRMEEFDVIKKRQPLSPSKKRRRLTVTAPQQGTPISQSNDIPNPTSLPSADPPPEPLISLADMLFGGQLTSILVCQKCKRVSQTYEDFNDLSLSIKPEDYVRGRKRDRLKSLARMLTSSFPGSPGAGNGAQAATEGDNLTVGLDILRSSSVPPTPRPTELEEGSLGAGVGLGIVGVGEDRRRSLDVGVTVPVVVAADDVGVIEDVKDDLERGLQNDSGKDGGDGSMTEDKEDASQVLVTDSVTIVGETDVHHENKEAHVEFIEAEKPEKVTETKEKGKDKEKDKRKKEGDVWATLGRRISMTVGFGKGKGKERKGRSLERPTLTIASAKTKDIQASTSTTADTTTLTSRSSVSENTEETVNIHASVSTTSLTELSPSTINGPPGLKPPAEKKPRSRPHSLSPLFSSSTSVPTLQRDPTSKRAKSPQMPKPSPAERAYLRKILADITTASASSSPLALFRATSSTSVVPGIGSQSSVQQSMWLKLGQLPGIEECLRMFTAVEVLDGENMVGCRRCWKLDNGTYFPRKTSGDALGMYDDEDDEEERQIDDQSAHDIRAMEFPSSTQVPSPITSTAPTRETLVTQPIPSQHVSPYSHPNISDVSDKSSVSSLPVASAFDSGVSLSLGRRKSIPASLESSDDDVSDRRTPPVDSHDGLHSPTPTTPGGLPIPLISTTAPESPLTARPHVLATGRNNAVVDDYHMVPIITSPPPLSTNGPAKVPHIHRHRLHNHDTPADESSHDSLQTPKVHYRRISHKVDLLETSTDDSSGEETDASIEASIYSGGSSASLHSPMPGPVGSPSNEAPLPSRPLLSPTRKSSRSKAKEVIMRPAYKRYLIATPPPILVIHLKRFQQLSKAPILSFSHGFKKLDDYVTFPEFLDLTPFLAPKKEDYGLGRKGKGQDNGEKAHKKVRTNDGDRCLYRLYAVVMHIGNMLGGHYVAYTALPPAPTSSPAATSPAPQPSTRQWAYISDTTVRLTTLEEVLKAKAYICMYERM